MTTSPATMPYTEPWLRGTHTEVPPAARAVLHALELAGDDACRWTDGLSDLEMHTQPYRADISGVPDPAHRRLDRPPADLCRRPPAFRGAIERDEGGAIGGGDARGTAGLFGRRAWQGSRAGARTGRNRFAYGAEGRPQESADHAGRRADPRCRPYAEARRTVGHHRKADEGNAGRVTGIAASQVSESRPGAPKQKSSF